MEFTKTDLNKTIRVKPAWLDKNRKRRVIDATWLHIGRLAVEISKLLLWKTKAHYCDFRDTGDFVLVQNVDKMTYSGRKWNQKNYFSYSWYKGNVKSITLDELMQKDPSKVLWYAVRWMLSKNKLRDKRMKRLKMEVWATNKYTHFKPVNITL